MDDTYAEIGTEVILGKHKRETVCGLRWCNDCMNPLIGKKTKITQTYRDDDGLLVCFVMGGVGPHAWRAEDMILASDVPLLTPKQKRQLGIK